MLAGRWRFIRRLGSPVVVVVEWMRTEEAQDPHHQLDKRWCVDPLARVFCSHRVGRRALVMFSMSSLYLSTPIIPPKNAFLTSYIYAGQKRIYGGGKGLSLHQFLRSTIFFALPPSSLVEVYPVL